MCGTTLPRQFLSTTLDLVGEPGVGRDDLLVDVDEPVDRAGPDRVAVGAVDLGLVALGEVAVVVGQRKYMPELPWSLILTSARNWKFL